MGDSDNPQVRYGRPEKTQMDPLTGDLPGLLLGNGPSPEDIRLAQYAIAVGGRDAGLSLTGRHALLDMLGIGEKNDRGCD